MKTILVSFMMLICAVSLNAQEKFSSYDCISLKKVYDIQISLSNNNVSLWIDGASLDNAVTSAGVKIEENQLINFLANLNEAKAKYVEWVKKAKENNVTELSKNIELTSKSQRMTAYFKYGDWQFDHNLKFTYEFRIIDGNNIEYLLILRSGELVSSTNQYINCKDFAIIFSTQDDILDFMNKISINNITEYKNKPKKDDLFK